MNPEFGDAERGPWTNWVTTLTLIVILLMESSFIPAGWTGFLYLAPVVIASVFLHGWLGAASGALCILITEYFNAVTWMPGPAPALAVVLAAGAVLSTLQILRQQRSDNPTETPPSTTVSHEWSTFFENSPAAIITADANGVIVLSNHAAQKLLASEDQPLAGQILGSYLPALASALKVERASQVYHSIAECKSWRRNGEMFLADVWFSIDRIDVGPRLGAVIVDAGERLQDRERWGLDSAMATSKIAIGAVLHEVRNLCAVAALIHANLKRLPSLELNADFAALGNLVQALAKIASVELRPTEASLTNVDLREVLNRLRLILDPWFTESEIKVQWDLAANLPPVRADEHGLLQIFLNLAQNSNQAMSSSERKQLTISASLERDLVTVRFQDTGPGVADPDALFRPFDRGATLRGVGLYVSRAIAHSFSGELKYHASGVGSTFVVELVPAPAWEKAGVEYGNATSSHQNPAR